MKPLSTEKISIVALILLITGAIDSIRNLPAAALFGPSLIFFFIFSAIIFLIPVALVSAELSSTWHEEEGGIYSWVKNAFGSNWAFLAIWLQWINTMIWYPTILSFIAGTIAYLIDPNLAQNKLFLIGTILSVFWLLTFLGLSGIQASARFASICAIFGMIIPMGLIIYLAAHWFWQGKPIAITLNFKTLIPHWGDTQSWASLTAIMTSFLGMELAAVHVRNIDNPQKNYPRAMLFSVILVLITMILGSLAIAIVLPNNQINLVDGVLQAFNDFFKVYHLSKFMPVIVGLILLGSIGSMVNWIISPAKGLLLAADQGFLPHWLYRLNKHGVASRILILQAILVTVFCSFFLLLPTVNEIYWLFTDLSTELYIGMYVLMFFAAIHLKRKFPNKHRPFAIPGKHLGYYLTCFLGICGCTITLIVGFIPPQESLNMANKANFQMIFTVGLLLLITPALLFYWHKHLDQNKS